MGPAPKSQKSTQPNEGPDTVYLGAWTGCPGLGTPGLGTPEVPGKGAFYYINYHNSGTFFGLTDSTLAILKPVEVGKSYIPQKKAL